MIFLSLNIHFDFSFLKGDMFIVHNEIDDGWMWVTNVRTEEQGLIVEDLVEEVVSTAQDEKAISNVCRRCVSKHYVDYSEN